LDDYDIMECVDEGLDLFGSNLRYLVYWRMTILNNLPRGGILANPEAFVKGLESIYGTAAKQIETAIVNKISERSGIKTVQSASLPEAIHCVRRMADQIEVPVRK
jgi:hypothetical protein